MFNTPPRFVRVVEMTPFRLHRACSTLRPPNDQATFLGVATLLLLALACGDQIVHRPRFLELRGLCVNKPTNCRLGCRITYLRGPLQQSRALPVVGVFSLLSPFYTTNDILRRHCTAFTHTDTHPRTMKSYHTFRRKKSVVTPGRQLTVELPLETLRNALND